MKQKHDNTPVGSKTTILDVIHWGAALRSLHTRMAPYFARPEPRHRCSYDTAIFERAQDQNARRAA